MRCELRCSLDKLVADESARASDPDGIRVHGLEVKVQNQANNETERHANICQLTESARVYLAILLVPLIATQETASFPISHSESIGNMFLQTDYPHPFPSRFEFSSDQVH